MGYASAVASGCCAGLMYATNKQLTGQLPALSVTFFEAVVATLVLLPWYLVRFRGSLWPRQTPWRWLLLFAATGVMLFYFRTVGVALTGPTTASLVTRFELVLVLVYSHLFLGEKPTPVGWLGAGALVAGMVAAADLSGQELVLRLGGIAAALACACGIALNAVIIRLHLGRVRNELTALANVSCQVAVLPCFMLAAGEGRQLLPALGEPRLLLPLLIAGGCIPAMLVSYYYSMKRIPMWSCRLLNLVTPVVALLLEHFWLRATISAGQLAGLGLVTGGAALVITSGLPASRRARAGQPASGGPQPQG